MEKMNFEKLTEKLETLSNGYSGMLIAWLSSLSNRLVRDEYYDTIYGFLRGLAAVSFITQSEEKELLDLLLNLAYVDSKQVQV